MEFISFLAVPTVSNQNISIDGFRGEYTTLMCPIRLPSESSLYRIQWEEFIGSGSKKLLNDSDILSHVISPNSTTLSVLISSKRVFKCRVNLQRCSGITSCSRHTIVGPFMVIRVHGEYYHYKQQFMTVCLFSEGSAITFSPSSQEVRNGDTAMFQCNAKGTNVSVTWRIDGSTCSPDNCEQNGFTAYQNANSFQVNATLEFDLFTTKALHTLQCIVEQNLTSSLLMRNNQVVTFNLTVIHENNLELGKYPQR